MKVFVLLFCLLLAALAMPASAENMEEAGIERSDSVLIADQNEDLVGAESRRYRYRGGGDRYYKGGGGGGGGGSYYGKGYNRGYGRGGY